MPLRRKTHFTEDWLRGIHQGAPSRRKNLIESESEGLCLYADRHYPIRYEDILADPFAKIKNCGYSWASAR